MKAKPRDEDCLAASCRLTCIRDYIRRDNPEAATEVAARIIDSAERLAEQPHIGRPGRVLGTRELVIAGAPYIVPYRVRGEWSEIAVFHGRRKWPNRL